MVTCVVENCKTKSGQGIHLYTFPKDTERRKLWIDSLNRKNYQPGPHARLCALHFTPDQFIINPELAKSIGYYQTKRNDLKYDAVPSIFKEETELETLNSEVKDIMDSSEVNTCLYDDSIVANIKQEAPDIDESQEYPSYYGGTENGQSNGKSDDPFEQSFPLHPGFVGEDNQPVQGTDEESVGNGLSDGTMFMTLTQELNEQGETFENEVQNSNMEIQNSENDINRDSYEMPSDGTFKCKYCCIKFVSFTGLTEHITRLHKDKYKCRYCSKRFVRCQELAGHVRQTHLKGGSHKTAELDENIDSTNSTETSDTGAEPPDFLQYEASEFGLFYRCLYCYAKLSNEIAVKEHIMRLHNSKYRCKYCNQTFNRSQELAGHVRKAHLQDRQKFDVYKKHRPVSSFSQPARKSFDVSVKPYKKVKAKVTLTQTGYSKYRCGYCSMVFFKQQAMACHVRNSHKSRKALLKQGLNESSKGQMTFLKGKKKNFKPGKTQLNLDSVKTEIKTEEGTSLTPDTENRNPSEMQQNFGQIRPERTEYTCKYCLLIFPRSQDLASHTRVSHPVACSHWCKYCPSTFTSKDRLANHVLRHLRHELKISKNGSSSCHLCRVKYPDLVSLRKHLRTHLKGKGNISEALENLVECKFCGQPFLTESSCQEHEEKHKIKTSEVKTEIKMEVTENNAVAENIPIKDSGKLTLDDIPFQCGMCTSRFPNSQYLLHHMTLHMQGKYVFKVEKDKDKPQEQQEAEMVKYCSTLKSMINSKQIIIPKVTGNISLDATKPGQGRIIYVKTKKPGVTDVSETISGRESDATVSADEEGTDKKQEDNLNNVDEEDTDKKREDNLNNVDVEGTDKKQEDNLNNVSIKSILKAHLGKSYKEIKKQVDNETLNKNSEHTAPELEKVTESLPNFDKIDEGALKKINKKTFKKGIDFANGQWQECQYCMFLCRTYKQYQSHMDGHNATEFIKCKICTRKFISKWHLSKHMDSHRNNEYQCTVCAATFSTSFHVLEHMSEHADDTMSTN